MHFTVIADEAAIHPMHISDSTVRSVYQGAKRTQLDRNLACLRDSNMLPGWIWIAGFFLHRVGKYKLVLMTKQYL